MGPHIEKMKLNNTSINPNLSLKDIINQQNKNRHILDQLQVSANNLDNDNGLDYIQKINDKQKELL